MATLRVALWQTAGILRDPAANLDRLADTAARAASAGARLLICPELYLTGYTIGPDLRRLAEPADGPAARRVAEIAAAHRVGVVYGYPELAGGTGGAVGTVHNSALFVGPGGEPPVNYRKTHLFGEYEHAHFTPGDEPVVAAELDGVRIGMLICYDVEFPETVRAHALAGVDLLAVPTAQDRRFAFVCTGLVPARAFESQLYVAYVNWHGAEEICEYAGLSCLAGPDGVARARAGGGEELLLADVDTALLRESRAANPYLRDRRPELYPSLAAPSGAPV